MVLLEMRAIGLLDATAEDETARSVTMRIAGCVFIGRSRFARLMILGETEAEWMVSYVCLVGQMLNPRNAQKSGYEKGTHLLASRNGHIGEPPKERFQCAPSSGRISARCPLMVLTKFPMFRYGHAAYAAKNYL